MLFARSKARPGLLIRGSFALLPLFLACVEGRASVRDPRLPDAVGSNLRVFGSSFVIAKWGCLVAPDTWVSATHWHPVPGDELIFGDGQSGIGPLGSRRRSLPRAFIIKRIIVNEL